MHDHWTVCTQAEPPRSNFAVNPGALCTFWRSAENFQTDATYSWPLGLMPRAEDHPIAKKCANFTFFIVVSQGTPTRTRECCGQLPKLQLSGGGVKIGKMGPSSQTV